MRRCGSIDMTLRGTDAALRGTDAALKKCRYDAEEVRIRRCGNADTAENETPGSVFIKSETERKKTKEKNSGKRLQMRG